MSDEAPPEPAALHVLTTRSTYDEVAGDSHFESGKNWTFVITAEPQVLPVKKNLPKRVPLKLGQAVGYLFFTCRGGQTNLVQTPENTSLQTRKLGCAEPQLVEASNTLKQPAMGAS